MTTKRDYVITLRPASGALVLGEVTNALKTLGYSRAVIFFDITTLHPQNEQRCQQPLAQQP